MADIEQVLFDMDGTLTTTTFDDEYSSVWHVTASVLGDEALAVQEELVDQWAAGDDRFVRDGQRDYELFVDATVEMHAEQGLTREMFYDEVLSHMAFNPGVEEAVDAINRAGYDTAIISGGVGPQAAYVGEELGIDAVYASCSYEWDDDGRLVDWQTYPSDHAGKTAFMHGLLAEKGLSPDQALFVGDGSNDVHIARTVSRDGGVSIGYDPADELRPVVDDVIDPAEDDFTAVVDRYDLH